MADSFNPQNLTFRTIEADAPGLPSNLAVVEADTHHEAIEKLVRAVRRVPVNMAVWNRTVTPELQDYAARFMRDRQGGLLDTIKAGQAPYLNGYISGYFNALAHERNLKGQDWNLHQSFAWDLMKFIEAVQDKFPKRLIDTSFSRGLSSPTNGFHLDGPADLRRDIGLIDESQLLYRPAIRFIVNYDGAPTAAAANEDVEFTRAKPLPYARGQHYGGSLKDSFNTVWEMAPWSIGVITNQRWTHPPSMHSGGISRAPGVYESRLRMLLTVK